MPNAPDRTPTYSWDKSIRQCYEEAVTSKVEMDHYQKLIVLAQLKAADAQQKAADAVARYTLWLALATVVLALCTAVQVWHGK